MAKAVAARLGREVGDRAWEKVRNVLGRTPEQAVLREAIRETLTTFERLHPEWAQSLFDQHFLSNTAAPIMARAVEPELFPAAEELAAAWDAQFHSSPQCLVGFDVDLVRACSTFLRLFR